MNQQITEFPKTTTAAPSDLLILETAAGTRAIKYGDLSGGSSGGDSGGIWDVEVRGMSGTALALPSFVLNSATVLEHGTGVYRVRNAEQKDFPLMLVMEGEKEEGASIGEITNLHMLFPYSALLTITVIPSFEGGTGTEDNVLILAQGIGMDEEAGTVGPFTVAITNSDGVWAQMPLG